MDYYKVGFSGTFLGSYTFPYQSLLLSTTVFNDILYIIIPANCTDKLQLLGLIVNKIVKDLIKRALGMVWQGY